MAAREKVWRIRSLFNVDRTIKWDGFGKARWSIRKEDTGILDQQSTLGIHPGKIQTHARQHKQQTSLWRQVYLICNSKNGNFLNVYH